jgi:transposase
MEAPLSVKADEIRRETLMRHQDKIIAFFKNRFTKAVCEGINSMLQAVKRKAGEGHPFEG